LKRKKFKGSVLPTFGYSPGLLVRYNQGRERKKKTTEGGRDPLWDLPDATNREKKRRSDAGDTVQLKRRRRIEDQEGKNGANSNHKFKLVTKKQELQNKTESRREGLRSRMG